MHLVLDDPNYLFHILVAKPDQVGCLFLVSYEAIWCFPNGNYSELSSGKTFLICLMKNFDLLSAFGSKKQRDSSSILIDPSSTHEKQVALLFCINSHLLRSCWPYSKLSDCRLIFPCRFATCSKPPSRCNHCKAFYPRTQLHDHKSSILPVFFHV